MKKNKKKKNDNEYNFDFMKTNKDHLLNIVNDTDIILPIINNLVNRTNKIVIHAYQFLKLYCLHLFDNNISLPIIDKIFISHIFIVLTQRKCNKGRCSVINMPDQLRTLSNFYKDHYSKLVVEDDIIYYDKLSYILPYEAIDMVTNINNNIQEHFLDHLNKYVHIVFDIKAKSDAITKTNKDKIIRKQLHKQLWDDINKVKKDLVTFGEFISDIKYHKWIAEQKSKLFGNKIKFDNDNILYDIKSHTQDYLISMFHIVNELEKINNKKTTDEKQIRLFNALPLRTNIVGKNICIDTCALICNFLGKEPTNPHLKNYKSDDNQNNLWNRFFKLDNRVFKKNKYAFNFMIRTDGISCCVLFIRTDDNGIPLKKTIKNKQHCEEDNTDYIEKTIITDELKQKKIVCADPNYSDLIYCGSRDDDGNLETFRYTQNQRRLETGTKKYSKIIDKINNDTIIEDHTIKQIESSLSDYNSKTCNYEKFKEYCIEKNKINYKLYKHYEQSFFRKFKLNRYTNMQKSESKMVKNFENKFGGPENTIFVMGDYDKGGYNMRGKEPVICKKFRRIFKNAGYKTYLINEFNTSKLCNCCNNELESFLERRCHKPKQYKEGKMEICNGLLRCKSVTPKCKIIHNRDKNAVQNMLNIVRSIFETGKRPDKFSRDPNSCQYQDWH